MRLNDQFGLIIEMETIRERTAVVVSLKDYHSEAGAEGLALKVRRRKENKLRRNHSSPQKSFHPAISFAKNWPRGWSQSDLARSPRRPVQTINMIVSENKPIMAETA